MGERQSAVSVQSTEADPRLLDMVGSEFARRNGIVPIGRVGALTLIAAPDMWSRLETIYHLEATLGPVSFVKLASPCSVDVGHGVIFGRGIRILS